MADALSGPPLFAGAFALCALAISFGLMGRFLPGMPAFFAGNRDLWDRFWAYRAVAAAAGAALVLTTAGPRAAGLDRPPLWMFTGAPVTLGGLLLLARRAAPPPRSRAPGQFPLLAAYTWPERTRWLLLYLPPLVFGEEVIFRGFGVAWLAPYFGPWGAALAQAVAYAFMQGGWSRGFTFRATVGAGLGALYVLSGNLWPALALHGFLDGLSAALPPRRATR